MKSHTIVTELLTALLLICLTLISQFNNVEATHCPAGSFYSKAGWGGCFSCDPGSYCPGDDLAHACPAGYVSPNSGSVSCTSCPQGFNTNPSHTQCSKCSSGRMTIDKTFCLMENTPFNAIPFVGNVLSIVVEPSLVQINSYVEVSFTNTDESEHAMTQLTLMSGGVNGVNTLVYASSTTGSPSATNYEYTGFGQNVTLAIKGRPDTTNLIYLNITLLAKPSKVPFQLISTFYNMVIDQIKTVQEGDNLITLNTKFEGEVIVQYPNKLAHSNIQFTISLEGYMFYHVFYSSNQLVDFPNPNNADFTYYGDARINHLVQVKAADRQPGMVKVAIQSKYGNGDVIRVSVKKL